MGLSWYMYTLKLWFVRKIILIIMDNKVSILITMNMDVIFINFSRIISMEKVNFIF